MKKILLIALICYALKSFGQDMIYLANGNSILGKIVVITKDSVRFKNLVNPKEAFFKCSFTDVKFAFNAVGNYLIFDPAKPLTDRDKSEFIASTPQLRPFDIAADLNGKLYVLEIASETEKEIGNGRIKLNKESLAFVIRKSGNHELFCAVAQAFPYLVKNKPNIDTLLVSPPEVPPVATKADSNAGGDWYVVPDAKALGKKVITEIEHVKEGINRLNSVNTDGVYADWIISYLAGRFFLHKGLDTRVEASSVKTGAKKTYKLLDYLNGLKKAHDFDKIFVEYVDVYYYTKWRKGPDGNYYGTATFVQKFSGFKDGNLVYCKKTKSNTIVTLLSNPPYHDLDFESGWDIYLGDIGVVETEK